ncbi:MAG: hypothetical protein ACI81T_000550 [Bacteroidia bacterium]|jgi:hypothetical protein
MILQFKLLGSSVDAWEAPLEPVLLLVFQILVLLYLFTKFTIEPPSLWKFSLWKFFFLFQGKIKKTK